MKKVIPVACLLFVLYAFTNQFNFEQEGIPIEEYRKLYSQPIKDWPKPNIDSGVVWQEFQPIAYNDTYAEDMGNPINILGKMLFFDPKLSGSNQISCSSCHDPEMGWSDGREHGLGNDHLLGNRNSLSLFNVGERKSFFWDGRASSLEEQANGPITALHEMNTTPKAMVKKLKRIKGYQVLFANAFGDKEVTYERVLRALASFQKTIKSNPSRFDEFLEGNYKALTDKEIYGMHIFRTKARCMNCHSGKYFTDEQFHNIGLTYYKRKYEDLGRYNITKKKEDVGKFRTPSLRDVMITAPWMHNGFFDDMQGVISMYNSGMQMMNPTEEEKQKDSLFPSTDPLMQPLDLTVGEAEALEAFLKAISNTKYKMSRPQFPVK